MDSKFSLGALLSPNPLIFHLLVQPPASATSVFISIKLNKHKAGAVALDAVGGSSLNGRVIEIFVSLFRADLIGCDSI